MGDPTSAPAADGSVRFERLNASADAVTAGQIRVEFARWLRTFFDLDPRRTSDLVLATNEALANSAEHAYPAAGRMGTTDVQATYDPIESTITVTVSDHGVWRMTEVTEMMAGNRSRGRGIPLMTTLSDRADIETSTAGTLVSLAWAGVHQR